PSAISSHRTDNPLSVLNVIPGSQAGARLAAMLLCGALAGSLEAQSLSFGQLDGAVRAADGGAVPSAEVRVQDRASGAVRWTLTARDGSFRFAVLPAGRYDVTVEALGYRPVVHLGVEVAVGH